MIASKSSNSIFSTLSTPEWSDKGIIQTFILLCS
nr:MAG TPA: hypothetical protein [Caudoviricetes sp.]